jgi:sugar lactone lactonase YvrE
MAAVRTSIVLALAAAAAFATSDVRIAADQPAPIPPVNDAPNPYNTIKDYFKLPNGRQWGSTSAVDVDKDGKSIWVAERCGSNSCLDPATNQIQNVPTILKFDTNGNLVKAFGEGMLVFPHGIHVDRDGNIWVTDGQDNAPRPARGGGAGAGAGRAAGAGAGAGTGAGGGGGAAAAVGAAAAGGQGGGRGTPQPQRANAGATKGHQVFKFSPDGKLLLTLGKPGGGNEPDYFFQPNDVLVAPNGDIFVSEGHQSTPGSQQRMLKFDKTGKLIKAWGKWGSGDGEFDQPHALAMDSRGRLFVGDRNNNRIQIFDQDGKFLDKWYQFSRPSGVYIDKNDNIYVADSESMSVSRNHDGWRRGIRIGSVKDGKVTAFIPDPDEKATGTSAAEGVVVDSMGNVYGAEVGPRAVKKYAKK